MATRVGKSIDATTANLGFEVNLCAAADALRNKMDTAECTHVVLSQVINLLSEHCVGSEADRSRDTLGRVYKYLGRSASTEGKSGGQFYTRSHVIHVLVEMLPPYKGRAYDRCNSSGGMFVQSEKFAEAHAGKLGDIGIYDQESNYTNWLLAHNEPRPAFNDNDWRGECLMVGEEGLQDGSQRANNTKAGTGHWA